MQRLYIGKYPQNAMRNDVETLHCNVLLFGILPRFMYIQNLQLKTYNQNKSLESEWGRSEAISKTILTLFHKFGTKQMKKRNINKRLLGVLLFFLSFTLQTYAQLSISAQIRPRGEVRKGLGTLKLKDAPSAGFISQRSRLSFNYKLDKVAFGMSGSTLLAKSLGNTRINGFSRCSYPLSILTRLKPFERVRLKPKLRFC